MNILSESEKPSTSPAARTTACGRGSTQRLSAERAVRRARSAAPAAPTAAAATIVRRPTRPGASAASEALWGARPGQGGEAPVDVDPPALGLDDRREVGGAGARGDADPRAHVRVEEARTLGGRKRRQAERRRGLGQGRRGQREDRGDRRRERG